jgi:tetratricopeptide (TPR) repeat protein
VGRNLRSKPQRRVAAAERSGANHRGPDRSHADSERGTAADRRPARRSRGTGCVSERRYYWQQRDSAPENLEKALEYFEQALEHDPRYALAYVGIAQYYSVLPIYSHSTPDEVFPKAKAAVSRALELDDALSEGHATLAYIKTYYDWDWAGAETEFRRSLALNPNDSTVLHWYSRYWRARVVSTKR